MGTRLTALNAVSELVSAGCLVKQVRESDGHISLPYLMVGVAVGFCYRVFTRRYVGGFFENPFRSVVVGLAWTISSLPIIASLDSDDAGSVSAGLSFGSFTARFVDWRRNK